MYLVVGANGFLGSYMLKNILDLTDERIIAVARNIDEVTRDLRIEWVSCDIADWKNVDCLLEKVNGYKDINVIFLAAYHNPDLVEKDPRKAWNINITSLSYFINKLENVRCFFYPSTDSVYGDSIDSYHYKEEDALNPVNTYGRQKVTAESVVTGYGYNVVRYPFLIAPSLSPVKKHFYDVIAENITNGKSMEMFKDSFRSSMSFDTAAALLIRVMENYTPDTPKILNICGDDALSKYEVGLMIAKKLGVSDELIVPVSSDETGGIFEASRAKSTLMDNTKLKELLGLKEIKLIV